MTDEKLELSIPEELDQFLARIKDVLTKFDEEYILLAQNEQLSTTEALEKAQKLLFDAGTNLSKLSEEFSLFYDQKIKDDHFQNGKVGKIFLAFLDADNVLNIKNDVLEKALVVVK